MFREAHNSIPQDYSRSRNCPILDLRTGAQKLVYRGGGDRGVDLSWDFGSCSKADVWAQQLFHIPPQLSIVKAATTLRHDSSFRAGNAGLVSPASDFWVVEGFFLGAGSMGFEDRIIRFLHPWRAKSAWRKIVLHPCARNKAAAQCVSECRC